MRKSIYAAVALVLFIAGLAFGAYALIAHQRGVAPYVFLLCAPGAFMALVHVLEDRRARRAEGEGRSDAEDDDET